MVDNFTPNDPAAVPIEGTSTGPGGIRGFLNSRTGKIVIGAVLIVVLLAVVAAVMLPTLMNSQDPTTGTATVPPAGSGVTTTTAGASEETSPTYRKPKPLSTIFVFRDIFEPTVKPVVPSSPSTTDTASSDGTTDSAEVPDLPADTLFVQSIDTVDGEPVATFYWNGEIYTAGEGEALEGTPWRVISIDGQTVTLLYGDSRVTLTVGQGLTK